MKKLILVTSPPACGKTYLSKQLAKSLRHVVYLDKDTLIVLSKQIFAVAGQEYNRSSEFFKNNIRDYEYTAIVDLALDALDYDDMVLINAPFTQEIRSSSYMNDLRGKLAQKNARLYVIWIDATPALCHRRMIQRGSDRDIWKLAHWDEYLKTISFKIPYGIANPGDAHSLLLFNNTSQKEYEASMAKVLAVLEEHEV